MKDLENSKKKQNDSDSDSDGPSIKELANKKWGGDAEAKWKK